MLRQRSYTVKALTSNQTNYSRREKTKLDSLFFKPELKMNAATDGFI